MEVIFGTPYQKLLYVKVPYNLKRSDTIKEYWNVIEDSNYLRQRSLLEKDKLFSKIRHSRRKHIL